MYQWISRGRGLIVVSAIAALSILATGAEAGNGHGKKKWKKHKSRHVYSERWRAPRTVVVERRVVRSAPVYAACAPRYVSYRSPRVVVVRPAPYVRVGARIGAVDIAAIFGPRRQYSRYDYGCNFCDAHFASFATYERHVHGCDHRPRNVTIQARVWDDGGYDEWCDGHDGRYDDRWRGGYDDHDDDRYDDRDDDRYDDRYSRRDDGWYDGR
jgi:hypothetical protein